MVSQLKYWRRIGRTLTAKAKTITLSKTQTARNKAVLLLITKRSDGALFLCPKGEPMKHNRNSSRLNRFIKAQVGMALTCGGSGCYSDCATLFPAPEPHDSLRAFLTKHSRYGKHR